MKKLLILAFFFLLLIGGYFFLNKVQTKPLSQDTGPLEKITIGNIGEYSIFNLIAKENGYFKENGLDAKIIEYESGPPAIAGLIAGDVDVAVAADFVGVTNIFTNPQIKILTQASKHKVFYLLARKDKGISKPSAIKGKKVGVTRKSAGEFYLGQFLILNGLALQDIKIVDLPPSGLIKQFENGQLDAVVIFDPHAYNLEKKLAKSIVSWSAEGDQQTFALSYSTDTYITAHPELIKRYLQSLSQAEDYTRDHPTETKAFLAKKLHYTQDYVDHMWMNFTFAQGLDQALLLKMENEARWLIQNKLTTKTTVPNYLDSIYFTGIETIKPDAVTLIH